ncbi:hypothetical protein DFQ01_12269 [Paenibacillus cellulosilyticus]|uniref:Uncharacterized protein n=1 Tax=Paenibacillus cellulosilyticus TaxID=375489 RepID=A0A2V2YR24_9BACL|nr:hypothetical protein DFQ01_12269 [Paenibacillus cellulosilyticus]
MLPPSLAICDILTDTSDTISSKLVMLSFNGRHRPYSCAAQHQGRIFAQIETLESVRFRTSLISSK